MRKLNTITIESLITISLLIFLTILLNPFKLNMPSFSIYVFAFIGTAWFIIFAMFLYKDNAEDERELVHSKISGYNAYLIGVASLMIAIMSEVIGKGSFDVWLAFTLGAMVLVKFLSRLYNNTNG